MKASEIPLVRIVAQRLVGEQFESAAAVVRHLTCMQAQDYPGSRISVALRLKSRSLQQVDDAYNQAQIVRSWPMRGTVHIVLAEDLGWMLGLTSEKMRAARNKSHFKLGRPTDTYDRLEVFTRDLIKTRKSISREDLSQAMNEEGFVTDSNDVYRNIFDLAQRLVLCNGPIKDGKQQLVMYEKWVKKPRILEREAALSEWALRYFTSHGPAPVKDFAWWTKLPAADVKFAVNAVRDQLHGETVDGVEYLMAPDALDRYAEWKTAAKKPLLLPGFDEFVLGYGNREQILVNGSMDQLVPGRNGMFLASMVNNGAIVGTWKHLGAKVGRGLSPTNWQSAMSPALSKAFDSAYLNLPQ